MSDIMLTKEDIEGYASLAEDNLGTRNTLPLRAITVASLCHLALKGIESEEDNNLLRTFALEVLEANQSPHIPAMLHKLSLLVPKIKAYFGEALARTGIDVPDLVAKIAAGTHVVVPKEPTPEMIDAWSSACPDDTTGEDAAWATADWTAMIAASTAKAGGE